MWSFLLLELGASGLKGVWAVGGRGEGAGGDSAAEVIAAGDGGVLEREGKRTHRLLDLVIFTCPLVQTAASGSVTAGT